MKPTGESGRRACDDCLRRTDLLAALAPRLDIEWRRRSAPAGVLSLPGDALVALDPTGAAARRHAAFDPRAARERIGAAGLRAVCRCCDGYPDRLRELDDPPAVLHVAGDPTALAQPHSVAVVGARRGTGYGIEVARSLGRSLSVAGLAVCSGLALGVDSAAHVGALEGSGRAVGVLAGGADVPYPARNRGLYRAIAGRGCVVSELPPGLGPHRWAFVARNRIIAGLAAMTVVVEATERSGSLTTADFAAQAGRAVGAVPGAITSRFSQGTNGLLAAGATVVCGARDVLDVVLGPGAADSLASAPAPEPLEPGLRRLLGAIERGHGTPAELATGADDFARVLHDLTELELRGLVRRDFGGRYVRALEGGR
jgi:DNA processing protein